MFPSPHSKSSSSCKELCGQELPGRHMAQSVLATMLEQAPDARKSNKKTSENVKRETYYPDESCSPICSLIMEIYVTITAVSYSLQPSLTYSHKAKNKKNKHFRKATYLGSRLNGHTVGFHPQTQKVEPPCTVQWKGLHESTAQ